MKSIVIYFSHTGENYMKDGIQNIDIGNTEIVANIIKEATGADLFKVETIQPYPYHYHECCNLAKDELQSNSRPKLKNKLENINDYDIIYIGGPVWWDHYPCGIFSVLENLDFTGKIVKPFTTHEGSGLGSILKDIQQFCTGAHIKEGLAIRGSHVNSSKEKIESWCKQ